MFPDLMVNFGESESQQHLKFFSPTYLLLYCLPIYIEQQKVFLIPDLYSFLQAYYLYD